MPILRGQVVEAISDQKNLFPSRLFQDMKTTQIGNIGE